MKSLRRLRLSTALAMALTLMACAASPPTETSVFDTLARANAVQQPAGCDTRFEIKSCQSSTGMRGDQACACVSREVLNDPNFRTF